jgi:hypothetical protein
MTDAQRRWREKNREKLRDINRRYFYKNRDKIKARRAEYLRRYRLEHKEQRSAAGKLLYAQKRDEILARQKARLQDPEVRARRNEWQRNHAKLNRPKMNEYRHRWAAKHPDVLARTRAEFDAKHPFYTEAHYLKNKAKRAAQNRVWREVNRGHWRAIKSERRVLEMMAMPKWADRSAIVAIYNEAARKSLETGIPHEVDHIWPIHGKGFVGLHVHWNLRVVPAQVNRKKGAKRPDQEKEEKSYVNVAFE